MKDTVRLGVIGIGNQGGNYLTSFRDGKLNDIEITCVADIDERKFERAKEKIPDIVCFDSAGAL